MVTYTDLHTMQMDSPCAVAIGFFDGIHLGHRKVLDSMLDFQKDGLSSCVFSYTVSGQIPQAKAGLCYLRPLSLKCRYLEEMSVETLVMPAFESFSALTPEEFARDILREKLQAKVVCCGSDLRYGKNACADAARLAEDGRRFGFQVRIVPPVCVDGKRISSSRIREYIRAGELEKANELLDRPFALDFEVIRGNQLGRTMAFPTINQAFPKRFVIPKFGVYASVALVDGRCYPAVTNVGVKPTVGSDRVLAETHIVGYSGDLYGCSVEVRLLKFTRPERKFPDMEQLKAQIAEDTQQSLDYLKKQWSRFGKEEKTLYRHR